MNVTTEENASEFASRIDHTILGPETTEEDVIQLVIEAGATGMNVCVPPCYVDVAVSMKDAMEHDYNVVTVGGFPNGTEDPQTKVQQAQTAYEHGADEFDMVFNVGKFKSGKRAYVKREIEAVVSQTPMTTKVIVCTPLLSETEMQPAAKLVREAGADFVKTATGFNGGGATIPAVTRLASEHQVKASGGIGSYTDAKEMLDAGAERIGASSGLEILTGHPGVTVEE